MSYKDSILGLFQVWIVYDIYHIPYPLFNHDKDTNTVSFGKENSSISATNADTDPDWIRYISTRLHP